MIKSLCFLKHSRHLYPALLLRISSSHRAAITMVFYGLSLNTSNMRGNAYLNSFFSAAIDIVAAVAIWLLINRVSRPTILPSTLLLCSITLLIIKLVPEGLNIL